MRKFATIIFGVYIHTGAVFLLLLTLTILTFLLNKGILSLEVVDSDHSALVTLLQILKEIWPAIVGTICVTFSAVVIATPAGVLSGIFINEYTSGRKNKLFLFLSGFVLLPGLNSYKTLRTADEILENVTAFNFEDNSGYSGVAGF